MGPLHFSFIMSVGCDDDERVIALALLAIKDALCGELLDRFKVGWLSAKWCGHIFTYASGLLFFHHA